MKFSTQTVLVAFLYTCLEGSAVADDTHSVKLSAKRSEQLSVVPSDIVWDKNPTIGAFVAAYSPKKDAPSITKTHRELLTLNVPESSQYDLAYKLDIPNTPAYQSNPVLYSTAPVVNDFVLEFSRIAYYMRLINNQGLVQWVWVSMDAFTDNVTKIAIPTVSSGAIFQQEVYNMNVASSNTDIDGYKGIGNIEFWPYGYQPSNKKNVKGASSSLYDWGDSFVHGYGSHGSMQVHAANLSSTLFAFNNWNNIRVIDIGIGNSQGGKLDWTNSNNGKNYITKTIEVFIQRTRTSEPSLLPSAKPSGARSDEPSNQPSNNPTIEEAPKFEWYIDLMKNATMSGERALLIDFNISNRVFDIDVFQTDCVTNVIAALKETETVTGLGNGFKKVAVSVEIDQANIESNNVWTSSTNGGEIDFCIAMKLFLNETRRDLIQFMETQFKIIVDKTTQFTISEVMTGRISARSGGVENIDYEVDIDAYQCEDDGSRKIPTLMTQGDIMQVCVMVDESTSSIFEINQIYSFNITQGTGGTPVKVLYNDGNSMQYPTLTDVEKIDLPNNIIKVKFQLLGSFFSHDDPDSLKVTGIVKLALTKTRRHLQESAGAAFSVPRKLQRENSEFSLDVDLVGGSTSSAWKNSVNVLSSAILAGGVYTIW